MDDIPMCNLRRSLGRWFEDNYFLFIPAFLFIAFVAVLSYHDYQEKQILINSDDHKKITMTTWNTAAEDAPEEDDIQLDSMDEIYPTQIMPGEETELREKWEEAVPKDNEEPEREVAAAEIIQKQQDQIVETGGNAVLSRGSYTLRFKQVIKMTALAYCPGTPESGCPINSEGRSHCTGSTGAVTSTGKPAAAGTGSKNNPHLIAVDPEVIPLGSMVYIDGYGFAYAADRGGHIKGNKIDLLMATHEQALSFGRKKLTVYVLE